MLTEDQIDKATKAVIAAYWGERNRLSYLERLQIRQSVIVALTT